MQYDYNADGVKNAVMPSREFQIDVHEVILDAQTQLKLRSANLRHDEEGL